MTTVDPQMAQIAEVLTRAATKRAEFRRRRRRTYVVAIAAASAIAIAATAIAAQLNGPTVDQADEVRQAGSPASALRDVLNNEQATSGLDFKGVTTRSVMVLPEGSEYSGRSIVAALAPSGAACVKILDGAACGKLTSSSPIVSGILSHPSSGVRPLYFGVADDSVTRIVLNCDGVETAVTLSTQGGFYAVTPRSDQDPQCSQTVLQKNGTELRFP